MATISPFDTPVLQQQQRAVPLYVSYDAPPRMIIQPQTQTTAQQVWVAQSQPQPQPQLQPIPVQAAVETTSLTPQQQQQAVDIIAASNAIRAATTTPQTAFFPVSGTVSDLQLIPLRREIAMQPPFQQLQQQQLPQLQQQPSVLQGVVQVQQQPGLQFAPPRMVGGNLPAMRWGAQDAPRRRLNAEQDAYMASVAQLLQLTLGLVEVPASLAQTCRPFDVDEDSIGTTEAMLECLLCWLVETGKSSVKPMYFIFPSARAPWVSTVLRAFFYSSPLAAQQPGLSPFNWKHTVRRQMMGERVDDAVVELRTAYHRFLTSLFVAMWQILMRRRMQAAADTSYTQFLDTALRTLEPHLMTVAVLEARIRAMAARLQLLGNEFFSTARWLDEVGRLKQLVDPVIANLVVNYAVLMV